MLFLHNYSALQSDIKKGSRMRGWLHLAVISFVARPGNFSNRFLADLRMVSDLSVEFQLFKALTFSVQ
jgi:hypothetical protein